MLAVSIACFCRNSWAVQTLMVLRHWALCYKIKK